MGGGGLSSILALRWVWYVLKDIPDWVTETMTWKVGRGTDHSSKFSRLTDVSCLPQQAQPPLRPLGVLVKASAVAGSCFSLLQANHH